MTVRREILPIQNQIVRLGDADSTNPILTITGSSGVGKDHLLRLYEARYLRQMEQPLQVLNFGTLLSELLDANRDTLKDSSMSIIYQAQLAAIERIIQYSQETALILNSHLVYFQQGQLSFNPQIEELIRSRHYALVLADPAVILDRRRVDQSRNRVQLNEVELHREQFFMWTILKAVSDYFGSGLSVIRNDEEDVHQALALLSEIVDGEKLCKH